MLLEDQRLLHEELERLEQAIADRYLDEPKTHRGELRRDHEVANFVDRARQQSQRLLDIYKDTTGTRDAEVQAIPLGEPSEEFFKRYRDLKSFYQLYSNMPVENLELAFKSKQPGELDPVRAEVDRMFTGEEGYGRYFDLTMLHELYLNLPGMANARRKTYLQYVDTFDVFIWPELPISRKDKMTDEYFQYLRYLAAYLESFYQRAKPLEDFDQVFASFDRDFEEAWTNNEVPGWDDDETEVHKPEAPKMTEGIWCADCAKEFKNQNVYNHHLTQKKHLKAVQARQANGDAPATNDTNAIGTHRLKERAIAEREFRIRQLAKAMATKRHDTRHNIERRQGMTEREREQELALLNEDDEPQSDTNDKGEESEEEEKIYNPLKLPLAWDGKPIPYWLWKLHGLGVEWTCEICANDHYQGRRAFEKHFVEQKHLWGLRALGITNTSLFREITSIQEAVNLWNQIQSEKQKEKKVNENVVQMEDQYGNVMPERIYRDLQKQGLL
jgi:splicing factor 3A subunit 3